MVSWKRFLLFAHLGLLIAAIAFGRWLYAGALGQSDVLTVFNPYPQVAGSDILVHYPVNPYPHINTRSGHIVSNTFVYVRDWYQGLNGRLSVAIMNGLISRAAKQWCPTPESFPWWLMRALSLYCLLAMSLNFMAAVGWIWAKRPGMTLVLLAAVWSVWIVNPKIYVFSVIYDCLLTDRYVHGYLLSWMIIGVIHNWMGRSAWKWGLLAAGILFLGSEQDLFSVPVLLMAAAWVGLEGNADRMRNWFRQACYYGAWTGLAALIFFMSPGQRLKNTCLPINSINDFSPLEWYRRVITLGYGAIFPRLSDSLWIWHLILYGGLGLILAAWMIMRLKASRLSASRPSREMFGIGLMAFAFLTAFLASMTTLIVSSYFPPYALSYPSLLLVTGLAFSFWFILDGAAMAMDLIASSTRPARFAGTKPIIGYVKAGCTIILPVLVTIVLIGTVTVRAWPAVSAGYHQVMEQNRVRRQLYAEIVKLRDTTGQRYFVLVNLWKAPIWGLHMDEVWGRAGYFRWRGMEDVICLTEDEWAAAGRPQEQLYFKFDCAKMIQNPSDRKR